MKRRRGWWHVEAIALYGSGTKPPAIARSFGVTRQAVFWALKQAGVWRPFARATEAERLQSRLDRIDTDPAKCWEWPDARTPEGYGTIFTTETRTTEYAHRFAYRVLVGPIPAGMLVLHRCDNPPCINPAHLFIGTDADNAQDRERKGRGKYGPRRPGITKNEDTRPMTTETVVSYHDNAPAINVKDNHAGRDYRTGIAGVIVAAMLDDGKRWEDGETILARAYGRVQSDFWQAAQEIAEQRGLGEIEQQGRSGGWLVFTSGYDPQADAEEEWVAGWLDAYRAMTEWADTWIADAPRKVAALAQQYAMDEAGEGAACRMFAFDVPRTWTCGRMAYVGHAEAHA